MIELKFMTMFRNVVFCFTVCMLSAGSALAQNPVFPAPKLYAGSSTSLSLTNYVCRDLNNDGYPDIAAAYSSGEYSVFSSNASGVYTNKTAQLGNGIPQNYAIAALDFNNDGLIELAVANTLGLILVNGSSAQTKTTGASPRDVAAADINNDTYDDIIVSCNGDTSVYVFTNTHPGFTSKRYKVGLKPGKLVTADVNKDGLMDICGINEGDHTIFVLTNSGSGLYNPAVFYDNVVQGANIITGDINNDGYPDLMVGNYYSSMNVTVFVNKGDGTYNAPFICAAGASISHLVSADFNGDGYADLAISNALNREIWTYLGAANATLSFNNKYNTAQQTVFMTVVDYNADSKLDIVSVGVGAGTFTVMPGNGSGGFGLLETYSAIDSYGTSPSMVAAADFNKDGTVDVATLNGVSISLITGNPDHTYNSPLNTRFNVDFLTKADYNNDGIVDIAGAGRYTGKLAVCLGRGNGRFDTLAPKTIKPAKDIVTGDFNGDHNMDLAVGFDAGFIGSSNGKITIYLGRGNGLFDSTTTFNTPGGDNLVLAAADFNRDGYDDLAIACSYDQNNAFRAYLSLHNGFFSTSQTLSIGYAGNAGVLYDVAAGDINNDQKLDLFVGGRSGAFVLLGTGNGTFTATKIYVAVTVNVMLDDYNNDGNLDFVMRPENDYTSCYVFMGTGTGTMTTSSPFKVLSGSPEFIHSFSADMNGDGFKDIISRSASNYVVRIFLGKGDGDFNAALTYTTVNTLGECIADDFNGDGKRDLAIAGAAGNDRMLQIMLNNGSFSGFPARPSALTATADASTVNLSWKDNSTTEIGFIIERSSSPYYGFTAIDTVSSDTELYSDQSAVVDTNYYYRVRAIAQLQTSPYSNMVNAEVANVTVVTDPQTTGEVRVFPNPANGQDGFRMETEAPVSILEVILINASGKQESHHSDVIYTQMKGLLIVKIRTEKALWTKKVEVF